MFKAPIEVLPDHAELLRANPKYWWHLTHAEWNPPPNRYVHVGTPQTILAYHEILVMTRSWKNPTPRTTPFLDEELFLYRVEVNPKMHINSQIAKDWNNWPVTTDEMRGVYKYVNSIEAPGSISLLVPFEDLTNITRVYTLDEGGN